MSLPYCLVCLHQSEITIFQAFLCRWREKDWRTGLGKIVRRNWVRRHDLRPRVGCGREHAVVARLHLGGGTAEADSPSRPGCRPHAETSSSSLPESPMSRRSPKCRAFYLERNGKSRAASGGDNTLLGNQTRFCGPASRFKERLF